MKISDLLEFASAGATSSGSVATNFAPIGKAPYGNVIKRMKKKSDYIFGETSTERKSPSLIKSRKKKD